MILRLRGLVDKAVGASQSSATIEFANDITLPASQFVLTMQDGSPFNYDSFVKTVRSPPPAPRSKPSECNG